MVLLQKVAHPLWKRRPFKLSNGRTRTMKETTLYEKATAPALNNFNWSLSLTLLFLLIRKLTRRFNEFLERDLSNISNTRRSVSSDIQTPRSELKNEAEGRVFLTDFEVVGYLMKHSFECLILLLKGISILRDIWDQSWRNFMLIKTTYPNFLHGSDFFCFGLMNY